MDPNFDYMASLEKMKAAVDVSTRSAGFLERRYKRIKMPRWLKKDHGNPLQQQYAAHDRLLEDGQIVWGAIIIANELLFENGKDDCPAAVLHSTDPYFLENPNDLLDISDRLEQLRGRVTTPEFQPVANALGDDYNMELHREVPTGLTDGLQCHYSTVVIVRKHILYGRLEGHLLPLLVGRDFTEAATVLPERYWDLGFINNAW